MANVQNKKVGAYSYSCSSARMFPLKEREGMVLILSKGNWQLRMLFSKASAEELCSNSKEPNLSHPGKPKLH